MALGQGLVSKRQQRTITDAPSDCVRGLFVEERVCPLGMPLRERNHRPRCPGEGVVLRASPSSNA